MTVGSKIGAFAISLVRDHLLAKLFAFLLAVGMIYLVNRDLQSTWIDGLELEVTTLAEARNATPMSHRLVLEPEANVCIIDDAQHARLRKLKVRIVGSSRDEMEFRKRFDIIIKVKRDWVSDDGTPRSHVVDANDISVGVQGARVEVLGEARDRTLWVDAFEEVQDVRLYFKPPDASLLPRGYLLDDKDSVVDPVTARVRGPRHRLGAIRKDRRVDLVFDDKTRLFEHNSAYRLGLDGALANQQVSLMGVQPVLRLRLKPDPAMEAVQLTLPEIDVGVLMPVEMLRELEVNNLRLDFQRRMTCRVVFKVSPALRGDSIETELLERLKPFIRAMVDLGTFTSLDSLERSTERPKISVHLPPGAELIRVDPDEVPILVKKKE